MDKQKVLIVDDEKEIRDAIEIYLKGSDIDVLKAGDGLEALDILEKENIHLIILDIMMPKLDGIRTCLKIRENKNIPVIMLSAKSEDADKILGLNIGADDYITKPFNPLELVARVKSQLRRFLLLGDANINSQVPSEDEIEIRGLNINKASNIVKVDGEEIKLTPLEFKIVLLFAENAGRVLSIKQIYENVWNESFYKSENTVTVHIRRIREKLEINPKEPKYIKVVWGIGYKIDK
ncbi:response regulator transcription factor [Clostridium aciditolerans]|uniref:Stage 0 sporulation protein A homolog n=1 Tax=Clostridium aciditolerans TaxID=339861 RepID=A0A934LZS1_9CLOT|nr:response regulator transcription factor [Clostridium aciditolerans]MBI6871289.1 response regulator transcription factor [Clostridium aciditolerans]